MKCYKHPQVDAVAVCAVCKRPICKSCQVVMEGRRFCKDHAERRLIREEQVASFQERGRALTFATLFAELNGLAGAFVGFLLILIGLLAPTAQGSSVVASSVAPFLTYFSAVTNYPPGEVLTVGFVAFTAGSVGMVAGYFIWKRSKWGAIASIILAIFGEALIATYLEILALAGPFTFVWVGTAALRVTLIALGWKHLK